MFRALIPALNRFIEAAQAAQKRRALQPIERQLRRDMTRAFQRQGDVFLGGFARLRGQFAESIMERDWLTVFDIAEQQTLSLFIDPIRNAAELALTAGAESLIRELAVDVSFRLSHPRAVAYIQEHGAELVRGINDTTRDQMRTLIRQATDEGWGYTRTADAIKAQFDGFAGLKPQAHIADRATLVAVTETGMAYEEGNAIVARDLRDAGLRMEKRWLTVGDDRVSDGCRSNEAEGWIPLEQPFSSGHMQPLRFPGCRCTVLYRRARGDNDG